MDAYVQLLNNKIQKIQEEQEILQKRLQETKDNIKRLKGMNKRKKRKQ